MFLLTRNQLKGNSLSDTFSKSMERLRQNQNQINLMLSNVIGPVACRRHGHSTLSKAAGKTTSKHLLWHLQLRHQSPTLPRRGLKAVTVARTISPLATSLEKSTLSNALVGSESLSTSNSMTTLMANSSRSRN